MPIRERDKITVCRHCLRPDFDIIRHCQEFGSGEDDPETVCVWPCGHAAEQYEPRCLSCSPLAESEMAPF